MAGQAGFSTNVDKIKHIAYGNQVEGIKRGALFHNGQFISLWLSAITLAWLSAGYGDVVEIEEGQTEPVSYDFVCTHTDAITHTETYTYECGGNYHWGGWSTSGETRIRCNVCNHCDTQIGWENQAWDSGQQIWVTTSLVGNTTQGERCTQPLTGTRTVTDCPANTQHGTATIQFKDNVLSVVSTIVNIPLPVYLPVHV